MRGTGLGDERGSVGGFEALPFGFLVFVAGTLLLANAWAVVDAKLAATAAAREAARAFVESDGPDGTAALVDARAAAEATVAAHGRDPARAEVTWEGRPSFTRCARVTAVVTYRVPTVSVPWVGAFGGTMAATGRHSEVVDPYRSGVPIDGTVSCV